MLRSLSAGAEMADTAWEVRCREEDMAQRALENERRAIDDALENERRANDDARHSVDEKARQLTVISLLSALIAGFAMVVMVMVEIPPDLSSFSATALLVIFATTTVLAVVFMAVAMLNALWLLLAIFRYDCVTREVPFAEFWRKRCEGNFIFAIKAFSYGVPLFMCVLAQIGWVIFWDHDQGWIIASSLVSAIAVCSMVLTVVRMY